LTDANIDRIAEAIVVIQEEEDTMTPALERQLRECEKGIDNLLNAIQAGILTSSTKERMEKLEAQREELKHSILQAKMERPKYTKEEIVQWISRYKYGNIDDTDYQKEIIDTFLNSIYVYDDRLVFTYNYRDGTETLTLKDIESAFGSDLGRIAPPKRKSRVCGFFFFLSLPSLSSAIAFSEKSKDKAKAARSEYPSVFVRLPRSAFIDLYSLSVIIIILIEPLPIGLALTMARCFLIASIP
jgi:hypothetical protein